MSRDKCWRILQKSPGSGSGSTRTGAYLCVKFGEDRCWIVTCRAQTDRQTNKHTNRQTQLINQLAEFRPATKAGHYIISLVEIIIRTFLCASNFVRSHLAIDVCLSVKRVYCDKTKAPSEKSSIMTNRKSPTSFPMSRRWTAYLPPNLVTVLILIRQMARCGRTHTPQLHACFQTVCHTMALLDAHSLSAVADQLVLPSWPRNVHLSLYSRNASQCAQSSYAVYEQWSSDSGPHRPHDLYIGLQSINHWRPTKHAVFTSTAWRLILHGASDSPVWPHRGGLGSADQSIKKPILVSLILLKHPLKALMLEASIARWSSWFHLLITLLEKNICSSPVCSEIYLVNWKNALEFPLCYYPR